MTNTVDNNPSSRDERVETVEVRLPRSSVMLNATVEYFGGGGQTKHRVRDLSPNGIRIDQASGMRVGATVLVTVGALEAIGATVRWVEDGHAGLAFAKQINPEHACARTALAPRQNAGTRLVRASAPVPTAGWASEIRNPYRK